jgi:hypothetical protein
MPEVINNGRNHLDSIRKSLALPPKSSIKPFIIPEFLKSAKIIAYIITHEKKCGMYKTVWLNFLNFEEDKSKIITASIKEGRKPAISRKKLIFTVFIITFIIFGEVKISLKLANPTQELRHGPSSIL